MSAGRVPADGAGRVDRTIESLLSGAEIRLQELEQAIRSQGCSLEQLDDIAAIQALLRAACRATIVEHARVRLERLALSGETTGVHAATGEIAAFIHHFYQ